MTTLRNIQVTLDKEKLNEGVNVGINGIYEFIKSYIPVNTNTIAQKFSDVTKRTIERWIKELKDEKKIEFIGVPKTGGYRVVNDDSKGK